MSLNKILLVDDEPHITCVLAYKLQRAGYEVETARDGEEAFQRACRFIPDLVITDLQMPVMSGLELCQRLFIHEATRSIPALLLTAREFLLDSDEVARTNIKRVLPKPFGPREVLALVDELLDGQGIEKRNAA